MKKKNKKRKIKQRMCQLCRERPATYGFNCEPCTKETKESNEKRAEQGEDPEYGCW